MVYALEIGEMISRVKLSVFERSVKKKILRKGRLDGWVGYLSQRGGGIFYSLTIPPLPSTQLATCSINQAYQLNLSTFATTSSQLDQLNLKLFEKLKQKLY